MAGHMCKVKSDQACSVSDIAPYIQCKSKVTSTCQKHISIAQISTCNNVFVFVFETVANIARLYHYEIVVNIK